MFSERMQLQPSWIAHVATFVAVLCGIGLLIKIIVGYAPKQDEIEHMLQRMGIWAPIGYIIMFGLASPFFVPNFIFLVPVSIVWTNKLVAMVLAMTGATLACTVGFVFARYLARDWVKHHLPNKFHQYDQALANHAFSVTIAVRFVFFLSPFSNWFFGLSRISYISFILGSMIGMTPSITMFVFIGNWFASSDNYYSLAGIFFTIMLLKIWIMYYWQKRLRRHVKLAEHSLSPTEYVGIRQVEIHETDSD